MKTKIDEFDKINKTESIQVRANKYLSLRKTPVAIKSLLDIQLSDHAYLPNIVDLRSDWVAWIAVPAFKKYRRKLGRKKIQSFCSIGTGSGLDVLSAIEVFNVQRVGLTDIHEDVVVTAVDNIIKNKIGSDLLNIEAGYGDLLSPLKKFGSKYDLIYENLPNLPLHNKINVKDERTSSVYLKPRKERVPVSVRKQMLDLHYLALDQAKDYLSPDGSVLSTMGARVPLDSFIKLGNHAGYHSEILLYKWKIQADAGEVIRDYAQKEKKGFGPFFFYDVSVLENHFGSLNQYISGSDALEVEDSLIKKRLDATTAFYELKKGKTIGHTVVVLSSKVR